MLYRLESNPKANPDRRLVIGCPWIEVLAIYSDAIERSLGGYGDWAMAVLHVTAVCRTSAGMATFSLSDITVAPEDGEDAEYVLV